MGKDKQKGQKGRSVLVLTVMVALAAALASAAFHTHGKLPRYPDVPRAATKPFKTFTEFYPFYRKEHAHPTNHFVHVVALSLTLLLALWQPRVLISGIIALSIGYMLCEVLQGLAHGYVEFAAMLVTFALSNVILTGKMRLEILLIGYGLSFAGHELWEHNKPATLIYPAFSAMSDFQQLYETAIGKIPLIVPKIPGVNA